MEAEIERGETLRELALSAPWYLRRLFVWMLQRQSDRIERMMAQAITALTELAKFSLRPVSQGIFDSYRQYSNLAGLGAANLNHVYLGQLAWSSGLANAQKVAEVWNAKKATEDWDRLNRAPR